MTTPATQRRLPSRIGQLGKDMAYLLWRFPVGLAGFIAVITMVSVGGGTIIIWVGIPILTATLYVALWYAALMRAAARGRGTAIIEPPARPRVHGVLSALTTVWRDPYAWRAVVFALVDWVVATFGFCVVITFGVGALGGVLAPTWMWALPATDAAENYDVAWLIDQMTGITVSQTVGNVITGALLAVIGWFVIPAVASLSAQVTRALVGGTEAARLAAEVRELQGRNTAATAAEAGAMRRLERDLHDGPQQRLVRLGMDLDAAQRRLADDPEQARALLAEAQRTTADTLAELRNLSRSIAPPILADRGLRAALVALVSRAPMESHLTGALPDLPDAIPLPVATAAYYVASEAIANVQKHAGASRIEVSCSLDSATLTVSISDDGVGGAQLLPGHGLAGLFDRVAAVGGTMRFDSGLPRMGADGEVLGVGTMLVVTLPVGTGRLPDNH